MALEQLLTEEEANSLIGKGFSIDSSSDYDRETFVDRVSALSDLQGHYSELRQNINNMDALNDVIGDILSYIPGDPKQNQAYFMRDPHSAIVLAERLLSEGHIAMAKFAERNRETLLEKLDDEKLFSLFANPNIPSYETNNPKYNQARYLKNKIIQLKQAEKDGKDPKGVVEKEVKDLLKKINPKQQAYIKENPGLFIPFIADAIIRKIQEKFEKQFKDEKGRLDRSELIRYFTANCDAVEDEMKDAPNKKEAYKLWDKSLKPLYLNLAGMVQESEEKAYKYENNPEKEDWKKEIKSKGMRA